MPPVKYISATDLRILFNEGRYEDLVGYGVLSEKLIREGVPAAQANQPPGSKSQVVAYLDANAKQVAIVHQYLRPDGKLGGSGKPDPKKLFHNGTLYILDESL
ncbi:MAG: hypothetical protein WA477_07695 [Candidatus Sulfotelmatobacter sp.]